MNMFNIYNMHAVITNRLILLLKLAKTVALLVWV